MLLLHVVCQRRVSGVDDLWTATFWTWLRFEFVVVPDVFVELRLAFESFRAA